MNQNNENGLLQLWAILIAGWKWWVGAGFAGFFLAFGASQFMTPLYQATLLVRIGQVGQVVGQGADALNGLIIEPVPVVLQRMSSDSFLNDLCARQACTEEERDTYKERIEVSQPKNTELLKITVKAPSQEVANKLSQAVLAELAEAHQALSDPSVLLLKQRLSDAQARLDAFNEERERVQQALLTSRTGADASLSLQLVALISQQTLSNLSQEVRNLETALALPQTRPTGAMQATSVTKHPVSPKTRLMLVVGLLAGVFWGILGLFLSQAIKKRKQINE